MVLIDKSLHCGIQKASILQHLLIPCLQWPLPRYKFLLSCSRQKQKISCFIRKWFKLHNLTWNVCLYSAASPCPLPLKRVTSVLKSSKVSNICFWESCLTVWFQRQRLTSGNQSGNWKASEAMKEAKSNLEF